MSRLGRIAKEMSWRVVTIVLFLTCFLLWEVTSPSPAQSNAERSSLITLSVHSLTVLGLISDVTPLISLINALAIKKMLLIVTGSNFP